MSFSTGVGSMPGEDQRAFDEAVKLALGEVDLPVLPEGPGRGVTAAMTGRTLALGTELGADLQPAGGRLTGGGSGVDHRRAQSLLTQDLDTLEEQAAGLTGAFKIQLAGPWTLAATVERPRGDRLLADHGARRDLAQALAEGVGQHVRDVRRRLPGADRLVVQVDEPGLASVLAGAVPTASGFGRHRSVHKPEASEALQHVIDAISAEGGEPWVHSCAPGTPLDLLRGAGARGLSVDLDVVDATGADQLAEALEAGETVVLGVVPTTDADLDDAHLTDRVLRWLDMLGLEPSGQLGISPACGLAGATPAWARRALELARATARNLA